MNVKQARELRKAIRSKFPNVDEATYKKLYKEAKKQYKMTNVIERSKKEIELL